MGRHIIVTVYFTDEYYRDLLAETEIENLAYYRELPHNKQAHQDMEKRRSDAMEDIDLYMSVWNDGEAYTSFDEHRSQCSITLPKKADLDAGLLSLVYHLFERGQITGFTVMHTGA